MEHIGIDLGGRESQVCVRTNDEKIVEERRMLTIKLGAYLSKKEAARVILETCSESFGIADQAIAAGHDVRVVPATLVKSLGVGRRGIKTDRRDAQVLSEVSCRIELPSVHIPSVRSRELKTLCGMREELVESRTKLINSVRGWLRAKAQRPRGGSTSTFAERARAHCAAKNVDVPRHVERLLASVEHLSEQIQDADRDVAERAKADEICRRLMTVPGVGPVTATRFRAAIDDVTRFPDAHKLESYLGIVPGERSSSDRKRRTSITKAGSTKLRWTLIQAAWCARRCRGAMMDPMVRWSFEVEKRRGKRIAIVGLARKIAGILYALWRDGSSYNPSKLLPGAR